jgi:hypothetical protein
MTVAKCIVRTLSFWLSLHQILGDEGFHAVWCTEVNAAAGWIELTLLGVETELKSTFLPEKDGSSANAGYQQE